MWASAGQGPSSSSPKQCKLDGRVKIYNSVSGDSARDRHRRNPRKKNIERAHWAQRYKKRVSVHWRAQCHAKWTRRSKEFQLSSGIKPMPPNSLLLTLTTKPLVRINYSKKTVNDSSYFATCKFGCSWNFCVQDCRSTVVLGFFQLEYQGPTRNMRILDRKLLIDTSYSIQHRLELKYFHLAQFLLEQLSDLEKVRTDNLKFRTDLRDRVMDGWSVTQ